MSSLKSVKVVFSINTRNYSNVLFHTIQKETCINTGSLLKYFLYQYERAIYGKKFKEEKETRRR